MKKLYFFTILMAMLLMVTGVMAQKKAKFQPAHSSSVINGMKG